MKLHSSVIERLIYLMNTYSGFENNEKLREQLRNLDLSTYERKTGNRETILVLTEDLLKMLNNPKGVE